VPKQSILVKRIEAAFLNTHSNWAVAVAAWVGFCFQRTKKGDFDGLSLFLTG